MKKPQLPKNKEAQRVVDFVKALTHSKGEWAGKPFQLKSWQEAIIRQLFGTLMEDGSGRRQYRTCYVEIPRKNGKTELAAALALYMLMGDGEKGAEVYSAAADREQASLVFSAAEHMVRNDPELSQDVEIIPSVRRMIYHPTRSFYRAIPADAPHAHGYNASAIFYDELHAAPNGELWDVLRTSVGARRQPLIMAITTAGWDRNSICWEQHDYAEKIRDGVITDPTYLPILYGAEAEADWLDEAVWRQCNPALGDFRSLEEMRTTAFQAKQVPARQNSFRRLYLCQWTESETRWLDPDAWAACGQEPIDVESLRGRSCYMGLDLASTADLSAAVLIFPDEDGGITVWPQFWLPDERLIERARRDRVPYDAWARDGYLALTSGNAVNQRAIYEWIVSVGERLGVQVLELGYDPWNAQGLISKLEETGLTCVPITQGFPSLTAPTKEVERHVLGQTLRHGNHPILRWHAANVVVDSDAAGNIKPNKKKSTQRIDGISALITGLARAIVSAPPSASVYETRGVLAF